MSEKKKLQAGDGYRLLNIGEDIFETDEYLNARGVWTFAFKPSVGMKVHMHNYPHRRRIEPVDNTGVQIHTGGPYVTVEAYRAALKEIDRLQWELRDAKAKNPPKQQPEPEPEWFDLTPFDSHQMRVQTDYAYYLPHDQSGEWKHTSALFSVSTVGELKKLGYTQFRCLIKDAPKPVEDPDEWVTQDRVPARPGVDERRWKNRYDVPDDWGSCAGLSEDAYHGLTTGSGHRLELRCRRRDLPQIPEPKPATQTIVFYEVIRRIAVCNEKKEEVITWTSYPMDSDFRTGETREVVR